MGGRRNERKKKGSCGLILKQRNHLAAPIVERSFIYHQGEGFDSNLNERMERGCVSVFEL